MSKERYDDGYEEKQGYPFALVLRLRVMQVVCGISALLMGAVALIEEKTLFNLGLGVPAGLSTILAAANNIYSSRGFDGYQPSSCKVPSVWIRLRVLGPTFRMATLNILLWSLAAVCLTSLAVRAFQVVTTGHLQSVTLNAIGGVELVLCLCVLCTVCSVTWIDSHYDPDWQEPPDLAHSNTGTAVSMVTLSQSAPV